MSDATTPITRELINAKLAQMIKEQLYSPNVLRADTALDKLDKDGELTDQLGLDSLDQIELIMAIEEEFDFEIQDEVAETLSTFNKMAEHIVAAKGVTA